MVMKMLYEQDYKELHRKGMFPGTTVMHYKDLIGNIFKMYDVKTLLDYGCGKALAYLKHEVDKQWGVKATLYDPGLPCFEKGLDGDNTYDAVICVDVLEHVPEDEVDAVLRTIFNRANKVVIITFCNRPAKKTLPFANINAHCTQKDKQWWQNKIESINRNVDYILFETD